MRRFLTFYHKLSNLLALFPNTWHSTSKPQEICLFLHKAHPNCNWLLRIQGEWSRPVHNIRLPISVYLRDGKFLPDLIMINNGLDLFLTPFYSCLQPIRSFWNFCMQQPNCGNNLHHVH